MPKPYRRGWKWYRRTDWEDPRPVGHYWRRAAQRWVMVAFLGRARKWAWRWEGAGWQRDGYPTATHAMRAAERAALNTAPRHRPGGQQ